MRIRSLLASAALSTALAVSAYAASLTPFTGPQDPSQLNATFNQLQNNIQSGVNGLLFAVVSTPASLGLTSEQALAKVAVPGNTLTKAGQSLRLRCAGYSGQSGSSINRTINLRFGSSSLTTNNFSNTSATGNWDLEMIVTYVASSTATQTQKIINRGVYMNGGAVVVVTPVSTAASDDLTQNQNAQCTVIQGTATASDTVLEDFFVEQIK